MTAGQCSVLHLLSLASPVTDRLYVLFEPLAQVRLLETLRERDIEWIAVSHDEYGRLRGQTCSPLRRVSWL